MNFEMFGSLKVKEIKIIKFNLLQRIIWGRPQMTFIKLNLKVSKFFTRNFNFEQFRSKIFFLQRFFMNVAHDIIYERPHNWTSHLNLFVFLLRIA